MRKVLISVLIALCVVFVAGCNGQGGVESSDISEDQSSIQDISTEESGVSEAESLDESESEDPIEESDESSGTSEMSDDKQGTFMDCTLPCAIELTSHNRITANVYGVLGNVGHFLSKWKGDIHGDDCCAYLFDNYEQLESVLNKFYENDRLGYLDEDGNALSLEDYLAYTQYDDLASSFSEYFEGENPNGVFVGVITYTKPSDQAYQFDSAQFIATSTEFSQGESLVLFVTYNVTQEPIEENPYVSSVGVEEFQSLIIIPNEGGSLNKVREILAINQTLNVLGAVIAE